MGQDFGIRGTTDSRMVVYHCHEGSAESSFDDAISRLLAWLPTQPPSISVRPKRASSSAYNNMDIVRSPPFNASRRCLGGPMRSHCRCRYSLPPARTRRCAERLLGRVDKRWRLLRRLRCGRSLRSINRRREALEGVVSRTWVWIIKAVRAVACHSLETQYVERQAQLNGHHSSTRTIQSFHQQRVEGAESIVLLRLAHGRQSYWPPRFVVLGGELSQTTTLQRRRVHHSCRSVVVNR